LIGERSGRVLRIGDKVRIRVSGVNVEERKIDFELLEHFGGEGMERIRKKGRKASAKNREEAEPGKTRRGKKGNLYVVEPSKAGKSKKSKGKKSKKKKDRITRKRK
jgi:ribonuclease R